MMGSVLPDFLTMLGHTHLIKMGAGLIRRDKEGSALSESAAGSLEGKAHGKEEKNEKNKTKQKSSRGKEWWLLGPASVSPAAPGQGCCKD